FASLNPSDGHSISGHGISRGVDGATSLAFLSALAPAHAEKARRPRHRQRPLRQSSRARAAAEGGERRAGGGPGPHAAGLRGDSLFGGSNSLFARKNSLLSN